MAASGETAARQASRRTLRNSREEIEEPEEIEDREAGKAGGAAATHRWAGVQAAVLGVGGAVYRRTGGDRGQRAPPVSHARSRAARRRPTTV